LVFGVVMLGYSRASPFACFAFALFKFHFEFFILQLAMFLQIIFLIATFGSHAQPYAVSGSYRGSSCGYESFLHGEIHRPGACIPVSTSRIEYRSFMFYSAVSSEVWISIYLASNIRLIINSVSAMRSL
jgi:hypothetical protein